MRLKRMYFIYIMFFVSFLIISARLYYLAAVNNKALRVLNNQQELTVNVNNVRQNIYDCNFELMVNKNKGYTAVIDPIKCSSETLEKIKEHLIYIEEKTFIAKVKKSKIFCVFVGDYKDNLDGVMFIESVARYSPDFQAQHLIGYVDKDGEKGETGIENAFNELLAQNNYKISAKYTVDAKRNAISKFAPKINTSGSKETRDGIILTIDNRIQNIAEKAMNKYIKKGAVIVSDIKTGEIRAMVSRPGYNPYMVENYFDSNNGELINRCLNAYSLGSIFKICVAVAGIESGEVDDYEYLCSGEIQMGEHTFKCHEENGHGKVDIKNAFAQSCNPFFISLCERVGAEKVLDVARRFGFDEQINLCNKIEAQKSLLPKLPSSKAAIANLAIGQGEISATPVMINSMISTIVNGGKKVSPSIIKCFIKNGKNFTAKEQTLEAQEVIDPITAWRMQYLMINTVENGTGKSANPEKFGAGGKTASAQTGIYKKNKEVLRTWFAGFFPAFDAKYAITVVSDEGKSGSQSSAPVFKAICDGMINLGIVK